MTDRILYVPIEEEYDTGFHSAPLVVAWVFLANISVLVAALRWKRYSFHVHAVLALVIIGLTLGGTVHLLALNWVRKNNYSTLQRTHNVSGLVMVIYLGVQTITGILARVIQYSSKVSSRTVLLVKKIHYIASYLLLILAKFQIYNAQFIHGKVTAAFFLFLAFDLLTIALYIWIKLFWQTMSERIIDPQVVLPAKQQQYKKDHKISAANQQNLPEPQTQRKFSAYDTDNPISSLPALDQVTNYYHSQTEIPIEKYVVFNDYVYDLQPFRKRHPGGQKVISLMNGRQIDRFMYGNYPSELTPGVRAYNHSRDCMALCGKPIGKMVRQPPMKGFKPLNRAKMTMCRRISENSSTYILHIQALTDDKKHYLSLKYTGMQQEKQIGQYFTLTISDKQNRHRVTRLYTTIWSMRAENVHFMANNYPNCTKFLYSSQPKEYDMDENFSSSDTEFNNQTEQIPIMVPFVIKKYETGKVTPRILKEHFSEELILSCPLGAGMNYEKLKPEGKVVFVSGGTGILPFCDLIDLFFKRVKYMEGSQLSNQMARRDPLICENLFKKREFVFYCAAESALDLPPLTIYEIDYLCQSVNIDFKSTFRIKADKSLVEKQFKNITLTTDYFNSLVSDHLREHKEKNNLCQVYICGPPGMNSGIGKILYKGGLSTKLYHFL